MDVVQLLLTPGVLVAGVVFLWRVYVHGRAQDREYVKGSFEAVRGELSHLSEGVAEVRRDVRSLADRVTDIDKRLVALETLVQERAQAAFTAGFMMQVAGGSASREQLPSGQPGAAREPGPG